MPTYTHKRGKTVQLTTQAQKKFILNSLHREKMKGTGGREKEGRRVEKREKSSYSTIHIGEPPHQSPFRKPNQAGEGGRLEAERRWRLSEGRS